jgi:hypothetical protein
VTIYEHLRTLSKAVRDDTATDDDLTSALDEAADMLEVMLGQLQISSPQMSGQHYYRFASGGWPMTHCRGPSSEQAVTAMAREVMRHAKRGDA